MRKNEREGEQEREGERGIEETHAWEDSGQRGAWIVRVWTSFVGGRFCRSKVAITMADGEDLTEREGEELRGWRGKREGGRERE